MKKDKNTKVETLKKIVKKFRDKRNWEQFHDPKNLAEAISIEVGELEELFLWKEENEIKKLLKKDKEFKKRVEDEFADIIIFSLNFANSTNIDISSALRRKIKKNAKKYPVNKAKNKSTKYTEL